MSFYRVKTEADEEGRTLQDLGIWEGNPINIALHLANKVYYNLYFTEEKINVVGEQTGDEVVFYLDENKIREQDLIPFKGLKSIEISELTGSSSCQVKIKTLKSKIEEIASKLTKEELIFIKNNIQDF